LGWDSVVSLARRRYPAWPNGAQASEPPAASTLSRDEVRTVIRNLFLSSLIAATTGVVCAAPPAASGPAPVVHCQVPCGIYGDRMRIDMLMEDAATIEKGMNQIAQLEADENAAANQLVRWIMNKDQHAAAIQETVASYWLAQRIKAPAGDDAAAKDKYHGQLALLHGITVAAMKCKQTTDTAHVAKLRALALEFSESYFSVEDLEHIHSHHGDHR
jgi:hypothetical protein